MGQQDPDSEFSLHVHARGRGSWGRSASVWPWVVVALVALLISSPSVWEWLAGIGLQCVD